MRWNTSHKVPRKNVRTKDTMLHSFHGNTYEHICVHINPLCVCVPPTPPAGYNNLEVAEYLLEHGADVNAQDKGGLIPLHNAASYGVSNSPPSLLHPIEPNKY